MRITNKLNSVTKSIINSIPFSPVNDYNNCLKEIARHPLDYLINQEYLKDKTSEYKNEINKTIKQFIANFLTTSYINDSRIIPWRISIDSTTYFKFEPILTDKSNPYETNSDFTEYSPNTRRLLYARMRYPEAYSRMIGGYCNDDSSDLYNSVSLFTNTKLSNEFEDPVVFKYTKISDEEIDNFIKVVKEPLTNKNLTICKNYIKKYLIDDDSKCSFANDISRIDIFIKYLLENKTKILGSKEFVFNKNIISKEWFMLLIYYYLSIDKISIEETEQVSYLLTNLLRPVKLQYPQMFKDIVFDMPLGEIKLYNHDDDFKAEIIEKNKKDNELMTALKGLNMVRNALDSSDTPPMPSTSATSSAESIRESEALPAPPAVHIPNTSSHERPSNLNDYFTKSLERIINLSYLGTFVISIATMDMDLQKKYHDVIKTIVKYKDGDKIYSYPKDFQANTGYILTYAVIARQYEEDFNVRCEFIKSYLELLLIIMNYYRSSSESDKSKILKSIKHEIKVIAYFYATLHRDNKIIIFIEDYEILTWDELEKKLEDTCIFMKETPENVKTIVDILGGDGEVKYSEYVNQFAYKVPESFLNELKKDTRNLFINPTKVYNIKFLNMLMFLDLYYNEILEKSTKHTKMVDNCTYVTTNDVGEMLTAGNKDSLILDGKKYILAPDQSSSTKSTQETQTTQTTQATQETQTTQATSASTQTSATTSASTQTSTTRSIDKTSMRNRSSLSLFWDGISIEKYEKLNYNDKIILSNCTHMFALFEHKGTTFCLPYEEALSYELTINRICFLNIPFNKDYTFYDIYNNVSKLLEKKIEKSSKYVNRVYSSDNLMKSKNLNIGLNEIGIKKFNECLKQCKEPSDVIISYLYLKSINSYVNKDVTFKMFGPDIQAYVNFVCKLLRKLGFKVTDVVKNVSYYRRITIEPYFTESTLSKQLFENGTLDKFRDKKNDIMGAIGEMFKFIYQFMNMKLDSDIKGGSMIDYYCPPNIFNSVENLNLNSLNGLNGKNDIFAVENELFKETLKDVLKNNINEEVFENITDILPENVITQKKILKEIKGGASVYQELRKHIDNSTSDGIVNVENNLIFKQILDSLSSIKPIDGNKPLSDEEKKRFYNSIATYIYSNNPLTHLGIGRPTRDILTSCRSIENKGVKITDNVKQDYIDSVKKVIAASVELYNLSVGFKVAADVTDIFYKKGLINKNTEEIQNLDIFEDLSRNSLVKKRKEEDNVVKGIMTILQRNLQYVDAGPTLNIVENLERP